jgi:hypothetical protein
MYKKALVKKHILCMHKFFYELNAGCNTGTILGIMNEVGRLYSVLYIMYNIYSVLDSNINFKGTFWAKLTGPKRHYWAV